MLVMMQRGLQLPLRLTPTPLLGNGNGTYKADVSYTYYTSGLSRQSYNYSVADLNNDGVNDIAIGNTDGSVSVTFGNSDGSFKGGGLYFNIGGGFRSWVQVGDLNHDGLIDIVSSSQGDDKVYVFLNNGNGTFKLNASYAAAAGARGVTLADLNGDDYLDIVNVGLTNSDVAVFIGCGDGTFRSAVSYAAPADSRFVLTADMNGDGIPDILSSSSAGGSLSVMLGNGNGTFRSQVSTVIVPSGVQFAVTDLNHDGIPDVVFDANAMAYVLSADTTTTNVMPRLNLYSQDSARSAITTLADIHNRIGTELGIIGSNQSRSKIAASVLSTMRDTYKAASSRISDIDVAEEAANLVKTQIQSQLTVSLLRQINLEPTLVLKLLNAN